MDDTPRLQGRCHCGAVTLSVPASSAGVVACHCDDCRRLHGNFFALLAADRDAVELSGAESVRRYASSATVERGFCAHCGSRLFKDTPGSPKLLVSAGLFGPVTGKHIVRHLWEGSKADWYEI